MAEAVKLTGLVVATGVATAVTGTVAQRAINGPDVGVANADPSQTVIDIAAIEKQSAMIPRQVSRAARFVVAVEGAGGVSTGIRLGKHAVVYPGSVQENELGLPCGTVRLYGSESGGIQSPVAPELAVYNKHHTLGLAATEVPLTQDAAPVAVTPAGLLAGEVVYIVYRHADGRPLDEPVIQPAAALGKTDTTSTYSFSLVTQAQKEDVPLADQVNDYRGGAVMNSRGVFVGMVSHDAPVDAAEIRAAAETGAGVELITDASHVQVSVVQPMGAGMLKDLVNYAVQNPEPSLHC